jgi:hypothetical protein
VWNVTAFGRSGWHQLAAVEITGPPSIEAVWQASQGRLSKESVLLGHLEAEVASGSLKEGKIGRQPSSALALLAEEESGEFEWSTNTKVVALDYWRRKSMSIDGVAKKARYSSRAVWRRQALTVSRASVRGAGR